MKYNNPITLNQADPWVYRHSDGFYYYTATYHAFDRLIIRKASSLEELESAPEYTLGIADTGWMKMRMIRWKRISKTTSISKRIPSLYA